MAISAREGFDCCFSVDHGSDDLAFFTILLRADDDVVSIADSRIDHGVADNLEHEEFALAHDGFGQREGLFDCLPGKDRSSGGDTPDEGDQPRAVCTRVLEVGCLTRQEYLQRPTPSGVAADEALLLQGLELVLDRGGGGQTGCRADFTDAGRISIGDEGFLDRLEYLELARGQPVLVGGTVGQFGDDTFRSAGICHGLSLEEIHQKFKHLFEFSCLLSVGWSINVLSNRRSKKE